MPQSLRDSTASVDVMLGDDGDGDDDNDDGEETATTAGAAAGAASASLEDGAAAGDDGAADDDGAAADDDGAAADDDGVADGGTAEDDGADADDDATLRDEWSRFSVLERLDDERGPNASSAEVSGGLGYDDAPEGREGREPSSSCARSPDRHTSMSSSSSAEHRFVGRSSVSSSISSISSLSSASSNAERSFDELVRTEASYVADLRTMVSVYARPATKLAFLSRENREAIFCNTEQLLVCNEALLEALQQPGEPEAVLASAFQKVAPCLKGRSPQP